MASLLEKVARSSNLSNAWNAIRHRPQSKGSDFVTISKFKEDLVSNLRKIGQELRSNKYKFKQLQGQPIPKAGGGFRPLRIPAVSDRVVQKAIQQIIQKPLERRYKINNPVSFAYIKGKSVLNAVKRVRDLYLNGYEWVYVADIQKFFDTIPPVKLVADYVEPVLSDDTITSLIVDALKTEIANSDEMLKVGLLDKFLSGDVGIAQGGILSPLFANVYMNELDRAMIDSTFEMVRYADDFVVMCRSEVDANAAHQLSKDILETKLHLKLHEVGGTKSKLESFSSLEFLGYRFEKDHLFPGTERSAKMIKVLQEFAKRPIRTSLIENLIFLRDMTASWAADFYCADMEPKLYKQLDESITYCLVQVMRKNHFVPRIRKYHPEMLEKLGISSFTQRVRAMKISKKHAHMEFYS